MNKPNNTDFFPDVEAQDDQLVAPEVYEPYQETDEDISHEKHLQELQADIDGKLGTASDDDLGELPYDAEADQKRWDELEKDFDHLLR